LSVNKIDISSMLTWLILLLIESNSTFSRFRDYFETTVLSVFITLLIIGISSTIFLDSDITEVYFFSSGFA
jgi:hypothetical protein